jgi:hypothetical protein
MSKSLRAVLILLSVGLFVPTVPAFAQTPGPEWLCDSSIEDCRTPLLDLISDETVGIDVAFWFMEDRRFADALIARHNDNVRVRVLIDQKADASYPLNSQMYGLLANAGIPIRRVGSRYFHLKMMVFAGQNRVQFGSANYSPSAFVPQQPLVNFQDETIYFTNDPDIVNSFKTKFDDNWINTSFFVNYANISGTPTRAYPVFPIHSDLNFPPAQDFGARAVGRYNAENAATGGRIDIIQYRMTDPRHADALIAAHQRGVAVRVIVEQREYRFTNRFMHSYNIDRLIAAGIPVRQRRHDGWNHEKLALLHGQRMAIFGSQNMAETSGQYEHNYFTRKAWLYDWFNDQFERKWNSASETEPFVPLPPDTPSYRAPQTGSTVQTTDVTLRWHGGFWAHKYDIYFGTSPNPPLVATDVPLGPSESATDLIEYPVTGLSMDTTYYWKVVSKTMANLTRTGTVWNFRVGQAPQPGSGDVVLWTSRAPVIQGTWAVTADSTAAGGSRIGTPDAGLKVSSALASPASYFEMSFNAEAGVAYRLWLRGKAAGNSWGSDSAFVQFSDSTTSTGSSTWRIGTTSATTVTIEDCTSCGLAAWGWNDNLSNGTAGALGTPVYFANSGTHTVRVQLREDGLSIDQLVLSRQAFMNVAPGTTKNDGTILLEQGGSGSPPPPPPPPPSGNEIVLHATSATTVGVWTKVADSTAASGVAIVMPDANRAKITTAYSRPNSYAELSFTAPANTSYHLWIRGRALNNGPSNDSVHVQFDNSVNESGAAIYRIGTNASAEVILEPCSGCGISGWGWEDNGWGTPTTLGADIRFATAGAQKIRIQGREDGFYIDQIVLSPTTYRTVAPGAAQNDNTILPEQTGGGTQPPPPTSADEIVLHANSATTVGVWTAVNDSTAADGRAIVMPDAGRAKITVPYSRPNSYAEFTFEAEGDTPYRLWVRGKALNNLASNDSVHVQFSDSINSDGAAAYRIGTNSSTEVVLEDCSGCGMQGWGWQDNGWGAPGLLGPQIRFATAGEKRMRIQGREDGLFIDQVVLSPDTYLVNPPGPQRNDDTILTESP